MHLAKGKIATIFIAVFLTISIGASMILIPSTVAHTPKWEISTFAHVQAVPEVVGKGQSVYIYMWLDKVYQGAAMDNNLRFHNYQLTVTAPDGTSKTVTVDVIADTTSSQGYSWSETDQVGVYNINFTFPGQTITDTGDAYVNDTYLPSSAAGTFTVQEEEISYLPSSYPLPTEYWARPIYGENTDWWAISSNWLGNGAPGYGGFSASYNSGGNGQLFPTDAIGPLTGHIMWTKPLQSGGVVGGDNYEIQGNTYFEGSAYIQRYQNPIIVNGRIYYTEPVSYTSSSGGPTKCVDLRTGELIWSRTDVPALSFAYIPDYENPNQHGVYNAILCTSSFGQCFDADTGNSLFNVTNVPSGRKAAGPNGEYLIYSVQNFGNTTNPDWYFTMWNSTKLWDWSSNTPSINATAANRIVSGSVAYEYNISIPWANPPNMPNNYVTFTWGSWSFSYLSTPFTIVEAYYDDMMLCYNGTLPSTGSNMFMGATTTFAPYTYFAVNLNPASGDVGDILWRKTITPSVNLTVLEGGVDPVNRVFVENFRETSQWIGYDLDTGNKLWGPTEPQAPMDYYGSPASGSLANAFSDGKMYSSAYAGIVYCYNTTNGNLLWTYGNGGAGNTTDSGWAVPGHYPTFVSAFGPDVVYTVTTEHTIETPLYKGSLFRALNATTGEEIWTLNGYVGEFMTTSYAIADGYATWFNGLDNQIYSVGRGPSQTTVEAPLTAVAAGTGAVIQGYVTDVSVGTTQSEQSARFPNGVPVASDLSMKDWMGYVYQQKPAPADNFTGVTVSLIALDPNNNWVSLGETTTDINGLYHFTWTPPDVPGDYTIYATFTGTNGYWPSKAVTAMTVGEPAATQAPTPEPVQSMADLYFLPAIAGLFVAIIVVGVVTILMVRSKP
jgi:outer membrane protein assembly factor BamB